MKTKKIILIAVGCFLLFKITGCWFKPDRPFEIIRSARVQKGDLQVTATSTGTVKPYNRVEVKPPIAGRVEEVLVSEGDQVKQGQILAWMSSTERAALLDTARSQGEEVYKRWLDAYKPAPLVAALDGMIIARLVEPGQTVATMEPIVVIADRLIVEALVDETDLALIKLGQQTRIELDAYHGQVIPGKVDHISYESLLVNNVNVYSIDIVPEKLPEDFRSGMTANITFVIADHKDQLLIPSEAVAEWPRDPKKRGERTKGDRPQFAAYKKSFGGKLTPVPITIGESDGRMTEVLSGLHENEEIQIVRRKQSQTTSAFSNQQRPNRGGGQGGGGGRPS